LDRSVVMIVGLAQRRGVRAVAGRTAYGRNASG
jgi:hypothetical protein